MENLEDILTDEDSVDIVFYCHDCGKPVRVRANNDGSGIIFQPQDGAAGYYPELSTGKREYFVKCAKCFEKAPRLTDFNPTEVYTRVVGYYRPVQSWNDGKRQEYQDRQNFTQSL